MRAVLLGFDLEIGDRKLKAHAVARQEASEEYERAIDQGDTAALIEHDGHGLYTVSLGNLMAGENAVLRYRYAETPGRTQRLRAPQRPHRHRPALRQPAGRRTRRPRHPWCEPAR